MIIIGYIFTILNYICYCSSRFFKSKKHILLLDLAAKVFTIFALYCFDSLTGSYIMLISFLLLIVANSKERQNNLNKWISLAGFISFVLLYTIALILTYQGISSILIFITSIITLICIWWLNPQNMRLVGVFNSFLYLGYQISIQNWAGLLEITVIISNILSFIKYKKK